MSSLSLSETPPRCWAEIDLSALRHNLAVCRRHAGENCGIMAVVKADAYGHGLKRIVRALDDVSWFGVANLQEAVHVREAAESREVNILILSPALPDEIEAIVAGEFSASVSTPGEVAAYAAAANTLGKTARLHAVADTGMGRMGSLPDAFPTLTQAVINSPTCRLEGIETHFPVADEDAAFTRGQIGRFHTLLKQIDLPDDCHIHLGNSAGLLGFSDLTGFAGLARPGLALYGVSPLPGHGDEVRPVLSWKSRITLAREIPAGVSISYGRTFVSEQPMRVATLGVGYGDGYPRHLSGTGAEVIIAGQRCTLLGRVTMDQIVVDISHLPETVSEGETATLLDDSITATELAEKAGTIPWEIFTGITNRVERVYTMM